MSEPYIGEIRMVSFDYAPQEWAHCDGSLLEIEPHQSLFAILGTTYGGDGVNTFALPDLRGRVPMHFGERYQQGEMGGTEQVALDTNQLPAHNHTLLASSERARQLLPADNFLTVVPPKIYTDPENLSSISSGSVLSTGEGQAHENRQPYLALNFIISLAGQLPSRS